jgi:hypothetical protein
MERKGTCRILVEKPEEKKRPLRRTKIKVDG